MTGNIPNIHPHIRSFVRRDSRITKAQKDALEDYWARFGIAPETAVDPRSAFADNDAPLILEIGFGNGESLWNTAARHPENNYLGIDVHRPGVGHLFLELNKRRLNNVRVYCADAIEILEDRIADGILDGIHLFFPDPWPKKRHRKRRLVSNAFVELIAIKLKGGGYVHVATDWEDYTRHIQLVFNQEKSFIPKFEDDFFHQRKKDRPRTKFEKRGLNLGHQVWDLIYKRKKQ